MITSVNKKLLYIILFFIFTCVLTACSQKTKNIVEEYHEKLTVYRENPNSFETVKLVGTINATGIRDADSTYIFMFENDTDRIFYCQKEMLDNIMNHSFQRMVKEIEIVYIPSQTNKQSLFALEIMEANETYGDPILITDLLLGKPVEIIYHQDFEEDLSGPSSLDLTMSAEEDIDLFLHKAENVMVYKRFPQNRFKKGYYGNKTDLTTTIDLLYENSKRQRIIITDLFFSISEDEGEEKSYGIRTIEEPPLIFMDVLISKQRNK